MFTFNRNPSGRSWLAVLLCAYLVTGLAQAQTVGGDPSREFARVEGAVITLGQYAERLRLEARQRFWHSGVPEAERASFEREVADQMVDELLLRDEALRRGFAADETAIAASLALLDDRNQDAEGWADARERVLAAVRHREETASLLEQLEEAVRDLPAPDETAVRDYYAANPEKFTEPERVRISVLLLRVDPSSPSSVWQDARERAGSLREQLDDGASFAALAREYSDEASASAGGDLGYMHAGTLGEVVDQALPEMQAGDVSEPLMLLEGVALVQLVDRIEPELHPFETVAERAEALLWRDRRDTAWAALLELLRGAADITIDESFLTPMAPEPEDS